MRVFFVATLFAALPFFVSCSDSSETGSLSESTSTLSAAPAKTETPQAAAAVILRLLETEDYTTLIQERYSEWPRVVDMPESPAPEQLLEQIAPRLAKQRDTLIGVYTQLAEAEFNLQTNDSPQPGETDQVGTAKAMYNGQEIEAKLYLMENGRWGFHL